MAGDRDFTGLGGMFKVPMTSLLTHLHPAVIAEQSENISNFHDDLSDPSHLPMVIIPRVDNYRDRERELLAICIHTTKVHNQMTMIHNVSRGDR